MFDQKITRCMSMLLSTTVMSTMLFSFNVEAKVKNPTGAKNGEVIIGDMTFAYTTSNLLNALKEASRRGFKGDELDAYYIMPDGIGPNPDGSDGLYFTKKFYNITKKFSVGSDGIYESAADGNDLWVNVKGELADGKFELFDTKKSSDSQIEAKPEFTGVISVDNNSDPKTITVPENSTADSIKLMTRPKGEDKFVEQVYKLEGDTLTVTAEDGTSTTYVVEVKKGGSGENQGISETPQIKTSFENGETISYNLNEKASDLTVTVENLATEDKAGIKKEDVSYQWYKQKVGTSPQSRINVPAEGAIEGATEASYTPLTDEFGTTVYFVVVTHKETFTENGETKTKEASSVMSNMVTVAVTEGELVEDTDFTVDDYVYNMASNKVETMGKLTGTAPSKAKITIEANFEEIATTDAKEDGTWEATFPRQNAGTKLKVTLTANGKTATIVKDVKAADTKDIEAFGKSIDLNKLIEVRDNLYLSKDKGATGIKAADLKDKAADDPDPVSLKDGDYYIEDDRNAVKAFKAYVDLIEAVLGYRYQISTVDLKYIQNIAIPTLETYKGRIQQVGGEVTNTVDLSINISGEGTLKATYEDGSNITVEGSTYKVNKGSKVKFDATTKEGNVIKFTWNEGQPDSSGDKNTLSITKQINANTTLDVLFTSKENMETAEKVEEAIKEAIEVIDSETKLMTIETTEAVTDAEAAKPIVQKYVKDLLTAKGVDESKVSIEVTKEESLQRLVSFKYTIIVKDIKTGDVLYRITLTVEFVNNEADFTVTTEAQNGEITAKYDDGENIHIKSDGTFFVDANEKRKVEFTATADEGYKFKNWIVDNADAGEANPLTTSITATTTVKAVFEEDKEQPPVKDTYDITVAANGNGIVKVTGYEDVTENTYTVNKGASVTFEAIPNADSEFVNWTVGTETKTANPLDITNVNADAEVTANFKLKNPDKEPSQKPTITGNSYTLVEDTNSDGDIFAQISGTAGANANITFEDAAGNKISTLNAVTADNKGAWTAIIQRQSGGTKVIAVAEETDKEKTKSDSYEVKAATSEDMKKITDVQKKINDIIGEGSKVEVSEDGAGLAKGTSYITKLEEEALKVMEGLLNKLGIDSLSGADITYLDGYINEALKVVVKTATGENLKEFADLGIENITNATVGEAVYTKVTGVPTDAANFDLTTTNTKVEIAYNADSKELEVVAKEVMTEVTTIDVKATADGYKDETVNFTITSKEANKPSDDKEFEGLGVRNITGATVNKAVYMDVYGIPEGVANFNIVSKNSELITVEYNKTKSQWEVTPKVAMNNTLVEVTASADGYKDKDLAFKITTIQENTKNAIKIVSVKTGENTFTDIPQDGSVEAIVYNNTVNGTVYQIYAKLSGSKAEFKIENGAVSFALDLVAYSDAETFSQADATNLLNGLEFDTSKKVLMKEINRTEGGTGTLNITLSSDVIKDIDGENPTEVSITFRYKQGKEVSSDNTILSPLVLKAIKSYIE